jgi:hypothetical protein
MMEYLVYAVGLLILGFTAWRIYLISFKGKIDETAWAEIRVLGYETINELVKLYNVHEDKDLFVDFIIEEIANKIAENEKLTAADKAFWSVDNLNAIFRPVIEQLINKIIQKVNK